MPFKHTWTLPELLELSDRLMGYGINGNTLDLVEVKRDSLAAGRVLAHLLLTQTITQTIVLGKPASN